MQQLTFDPEPLKPAGKLIFSLTVPGRMPSWNDLLGMEQWARYKFKGELADTFLSSLKATAAASWTLTTSPQNIMWTYAATLESYLRMRREQRILKSAKKKSEARKLKGLTSKSTRYQAEETPPF